MTGATPDVSVIVPVYNDPEGIVTTVKSVREALTPSSELIVVDNGSTDRTPDIAAAVLAEDPNCYLAHETEIQSSYAARNTGIDLATGDVLAFVDADMTVPEDWLESALEAFQAGGVDYMGCRVNLVLPDAPSLAARYDYHTGFPVERYVEHQHFAPTCCLFVRRTVVDDVGRFDHRLVSGGDKEFGNRVHDAGYGLHYARDVIVYHPTRNSIRALVSKDRRVGRGLCQLQRYHSERYGTPGIPPRPSGVKSTDADLSGRDRIAFGALSRILTGVRALGYYEEYVAGVRRSRRRDDSTS